MQIIIFGVFTMIMVRLLYQLHFRSFWNSKRVRLLMLVVFVPIFILLIKTIDMFRESEEYACVNSAEHDDMVFQNQKMEDLMDEQSDIARKTFVIWVGMFFICLGTFFGLQIHIMRLHELRRRREVVAVFLG